MSVGFAEEYPERDCAAAGCIHSVIDILSNVLRKSRTNSEAGCSNRFYAKERDITRSSSTASPTTTLLSAALRSIIMTTLEMAPRLTTRQLALRHSQETMTGIQTQRWVPTR